MGLFNRTNKYTKVNQDNVIAQIQSGVNPEVALPVNPQPLITKQDKMPKVTDLAKQSKELIPQIMEQLMAAQQKKQLEAQVQEEVLDESTELIEEEPKEHPNHKLFKKVQELKADIKAKQEAVLILESLY